MKQFPPPNPKFPHMIHGGDYNPDQWPEEVWEDDMRLMKLAKCNTMSVGIFAWTRLEPKEGKYDFDWLDKIMDKLAENNAFAILATPSGARPAWLSHKYPEVLRVRPDRLRNLHGARHNHCMTSPVYREKTQAINRALAERYAGHPALLMWHISNEFNGECHCDLCQDAFRSWLKKRYHNCLKELNQAWWTAFWSHTFTDWKEIESPSPVGEMFLHGLNLDWKRFSNHQTFDFFENEIKPLRELTPEVPITTNFMGFFEGINYPKFAKHVDVVSWDSYPVWHTTQSEWRLAASIGMAHDQNRSMKGGKPFLLMESTPSHTNWQPVPKLKRPGMHLLSSLQAVAHGSDSVQYFQWRKSRGSSEKFHGAVVDHVGHAETRVFKDVTAVGAALQKLDKVVGTSIQPETAIIFDWENRWAIDDLLGMGSKDRRRYMETVQAHYLPFWKRGVPVDVIDSEADFASYKLIVAPMLYMLRPGVAERLRNFVNHGGCLVFTYWSGIANESDLCFLGGWPGDGLREVFGIWHEESDMLTSGEVCRIKTITGNGLGLHGTYNAQDYFALVHAESAKVLAVFEDEFYAGRPALTENRYGEGRAFYVASRNEEAFTDAFLGGLVRELELETALPAELPRGVSAQSRQGEDGKFVFVMNFNCREVKFEIGKGHYVDILNGDKIHRKLTLPPYGVAVLQKQ